MPSDFTTKEATAILHDLVYAATAIKLAGTVTSKESHHDISEATAKIVVENSDMLKIIAAEEKRINAK